ncbi:hypothetical protein D1007_57776 [Hordeum vulgare]|nr:hypothetical protein D1007_57776 [Hordeum vulgare]
MQKSGPELHLHPYFGAGDICGRDYSLYNPAKDAQATIKDDESSIASSSSSASSSDDENRKDKPLISVVAGIALDEISNGEAETPPSSQRTMTIAAEGQAVYCSTTYLLLAKRRTWF